MSTDPEYDRVITLEPQVNGFEPVPPEAPIATELPLAPPALPAPPVEPAPKAVRTRPRWVVPAAIAAVGLIASGSLGYLFYTTNQKLEATAQTLAATKTQLASLQKEADHNKQVADYVSMYTVDAGKVRTDYEQVVACNSYSTCRTSAQQTLSDMQAFQSDRQSAQVPFELSASDSQLGDSLSAGIAALQELITGMDTDNVPKIKEGFKLLDNAMLGVAKAESALGAELKSVAHVSNAGSRTARIMAVALVAGVAATAGLAWRVQQDDAMEIARMQTEITQMRLQASQQTDWPRLAAAVEPSVFTVSTDDGLGSGWVVRSDASGSDLVTNFHVVADALAAGTESVDVLQADRTLKGTVVRTDRTDDLAVVHVKEKLTPLHAAAARPRVGATVMVVGSPLGLGGTISIGLVSGFRSIEGSDYVQFSAPISPGNSGGPVVDAQGRVIGIARGKFVGDGIEALGFAIPVSVACAQLGVCEET